MYRTILTAALVLSAAPALRAQGPGYYEPVFGNCAGPDDNCSALPRRFPFAAGCTNVSFLTGFDTSVATKGLDLSSAPQSFRVGCMLNTPPGGCEWYANAAWEAIGDFTYAPVSTGPADALVGPSLLLRYNHVDTSCALVPFVQAGVGALWNDAHRDARQNHLGQDVSLAARLGAGARYMFTDNVAMEAEVGYRHLSNLSQSERNAGVHSVGVQVGFTYFIGRR